MGALLKILVIVLAVAVVMVWMRVRAAEALARQKRDALQRRETGLPVSMVACRWCGTYIPESAAVQGKAGPYCCSQHCHLAER